MPVTPFHLGPALVLKAACPDGFSLGVFALVQVAMDVETVTNIVQGRFPIHGWLHTLAGSVAVAVLLIAPGRDGLSRLYQAAARVVRRLQDPWPWVLAELGPVPWPAAILGGLIGGVSHVLLDALIHADVEPFAPWIAGNALFVPASFLWVHVACSAASVPGLIAWHARRSHRP